MKLAALALLTTLGLGGAAYAEPAPPGRVAYAEPARPRGELRQILLQRFDANHDGRLDPQERRRAIHALRKLARRMARQDRRELRERNLVRPLDRNSDGWLDDRDRR